MEVYLDCLPCILRQVLESSRMSTDNKELHDKIMVEALSKLRHYRSFQNSPELCRDISSIVKIKTGQTDPYYQIKQRDMRTALRLYPKLRSFVDAQQDRLHWALKVAATGNVLDSAVDIGFDVEKALDAEVSKPFSICDTQLLEQQLKTAKSLLVIGDNAGETVFDSILLEQLAHLDLTYAVRSAPIINDATLEEAQASGIDRYAKIITSGCDAPGTLLGECNKKFLNHFYDADIVISKGQGNYETLLDCDRDVFFLLKAKCPVLSTLLSVDLNDYVFKFYQCAQA